MKLKYILIALILSMNFTVSTANQSKLQERRIEVVKKYLLFLQNADYKSIYSLFTKDGIVVSTSRGKVNAKDFFYGFLPEIRSAKTEMHKLFSNLDNSIAARFFFSFDLKNGEHGDGEYIDEFIFNQNSDQLKAVHMFENLKFKNLNN